MGNCAALRGQQGLAVFWAGIYGAEQQNQEPRGCRGFICLVRSRMVCTWRCDASSDVALAGHIAGQTPSGEPNLQQNGKYQVEKSKHIRDPVAPRPFLRPGLIRAAHRGCYKGPADDSRTIGDA